MSAVSKLFAVVLLFGPAAALADPVTISSKTTGMIVIGTPMLGTIDMHPPDDGFPSPGVPFLMQLESTFDTSASDVILRPDGTLIDPRTQVELLFTVGDRRLSFSGMGRSSVGMTAGGSYAHRVFLYVNGAEVQFQNIFEGPSRLFSGDLLALRDLSASDGLLGRFGASYNSDNPDRPGPDLGDGGPAGFASLQVSAVPEPAYAGMFVTGLLALGAFVRKRHA